MRFADLVAIMNCVPSNAAGETARQAQRRQGRRNTSAAQKRCEKWLADYARAYEAGTGFHIPRAELEAIARRRSGISKPAFERAWKKVAKAHPALSAHGRRKQNMKQETKPNPSAT